jgi:K+-transporting ATPase KdpF subunit
MQLCRKNFVMVTAILLTAFSFGNVSPLGYIIGGIVAVFLMGYLVYALLKPEKF